MTHPEQRFAIVLDHLPEGTRPLERSTLREAWATSSPVEARADLEALARGLARQRPGAAGSLREGLADTLTVTRLGATGTLLRTLASTSPWVDGRDRVCDHAHRGSTGSRVTSRCGGPLPA